MYNTKKGDNMIKLSIYRKKQFASRLVPFYLVVNEDIDKLMYALSQNNLVNAINTIRLYPIKSNETVLFNTNQSMIRLMAINNNFSNSTLYPLAFTQELQIVNDTNLLLEQTNFFSTVKIEFKQTNNNDKTNIIEYYI